MYDPDLKKIHRNLRKKYGISEEISNERKNFI